MTLAFLHLRILLQGDRLCDLQVLLDLRELGRIGRAKWRVDVTAQQIVQGLLGGLQLVLVLQQLELLVGQLRLYVEALGLEDDLFGDILRGDAIQLFVLLDAGLCRVDGVLDFHDRVVSLPHLVHQGDALLGHLQRGLLDLELLVLDEQVDLVQREQGLGGATDDIGGGLAWGGDREY